MVFEVRMVGRRDSRVLVSMGTPDPGEGEQIVGRQPSANLQLHSGGERATVFWLCGVRDAFFADRSAPAASDAALPGENQALVAWGLRELAEVSFFGSFWSLMAGFCGSVVLIFCVRSLHNDLDGLFSCSCLVSSRLDLTVEHEVCPEIMGRFVLSKVHRFRVELKDEASFAMT